MSRISHQGNDAAAAHAQHTADAQQKSANAQGARNGAQFAALYRGTTNFTYGSDAQRGPSVSSVRAKRMADQLARKRRAAKKQRSNGGGLDDDGPDDAEANHAEGHKVNRDGGGRGGGGGQSQGDHGDEHGTGTAPAIKARGDRGAVPAPPSGRLDAVAAQYAQPGQEGARAAAVRDAWRGDMLNLRGQLAANPQMPLDARVFEQSLDLLGVQQRIGSIAAALPGANSGVAALREHAGGVGAQGVTRLPPPERVQRFNLLFPLLWLHADKPATVTQRARSIDTLCGLRGGVLGRTPGAAAGGAGAAGEVGASAAPATANGSTTEARAQAAAAPPTPRRAFPGGSG
ncbi:hypothetical protein [Paraburkholderia bryophila]|jgi:hypothetical protein|uniref:Type III secretion regulatory protein HpaA n=1 Tax=Paraburkholderia bryophila TaxID=420952 RepID=A0A329CXM2_9BURK|nr:hypothetical protein [Paraburkholderia bryophila]RAS39239.1 hypothetical protein BX591_101576 [Paraburkholderia bryophila]